MESATVIPLVQSGAPAGSTLTFTDNAITVPTGVYLVSYGASGTNATGDSLAVQLYASGVAVPNSTATDTAGAAASGSVSRTMLYTATGATPLSVYNSTAQAINFTDAYLTVVRIA